MGTRRKNWDDRLWHFAVAAFIILIACTGLHTAYGELRFDSQVWKSENPGRNSKRKRMVNNLMDYVLEEGMTKKQVIAILGQSYHEPQSNHWKYDLGQIVFYSWDRRALNLKFDKSGKLAEYHVEYIFD